MGIYHMKRKDLIAKIERDQAAVASAAAVVSDNAALQAEIARLKGALVKEPDTPFPIRAAIQAATKWRRNSQMIDELAWVMGYTDAKVDDLFRAAMQVQA